MRFFALDLSNFLFNSKISERLLILFSFSWKTNYIADEQSTTGWPLYQEEFTTTIFVTLVLIS